MPTDPNSPNPILPSPGWPYSPIPTSVRLRSCPTPGDSSKIVSHTSPRMFIFSPIVRFIPSPRGGEGSSYSSERSFVWRRRVVYGNFVWRECVYLYRKTIRSIETLLSRRNQFDGAVLHRRACRTWYWRQLELPAGERQTTVKAAKQYFSFVLFLCLKLLSGLGKIGNVIYREFLFQRNRREIFLCSRVYCLETVIHLFQMLA